jgi:t-SNARE complex subunit (syntaxin)
VNDQNSLIDNITTNIDNTHTNVESGNDQLQKATKYAVNFFIFYKFSFFMIFLSSKIANL